MDSNTHIELGNQRHQNTDKQKHTKTSFGIKKLDDLMTSVSSLSKEVSSNMWIKGSNPTQVATKHNLKKSIIDWVEPRDHRNNAK